MFFQRTCVIRSYCVQDPLSKSRAQQKAYRDATAAPPAPADAEEAETDDAPPVMKKPAAAQKKESASLAFLRGTPVAAADADAGDFKKAEPAVEAVPLRDAGKAAFYKRMKNSGCVPQAPLQHVSHVRKLSTAHN